ncbi:unnamed protein product [Closterium sp. NIES-54]
MAKRAAASRVSQCERVALSAVAGGAGAKSGGAEPGGAEPGGVQPGGAESEGAGLSPRSSCASDLLSAPAFGVELPELETLPLETLKLEMLDLMLELVVPEVLLLLVLELLIPGVLELPGLVLETLRSLELLGLEELELLAMELETLELEELELEVLEALCGRDRTSFHYFSRFLVSPPTSLPPPLLCPLCDQSQPPFQPPSPLPAPSLYAEQTGGLTERRKPAYRPASPDHTGRRVPRPRPPPVFGTHAMALRPSSVPLRVPLPPPPESSLPAIPDPESDRARAASPSVSRLLATVVTDPSFDSTPASALVAELVDFAAACRLDFATALIAASESVCPPSVGGECALRTDVLEDRQEDFEFLEAAVPRFASMLLAHEGDPDALDIPTPRSYAEAITARPAPQRAAAAHAATTALCPAEQRCPGRAAPPSPSRPPATTAAAAAVRATGAAGSAAGAGGAGGSTGSAGGAAGAGGGRGASGSAGAARGGQRQSLPLPDDPTPQQLRKWVLQQARPGGGGFGFLHTAHRRKQSQHETFSPQVLSELVLQRCVTGSIEVAALGASESAAALGASESAAAPDANVSGVLIPWIRATRRQLRERFRQDFPVLHLHSDRGGEFSSDLLVEFCRDEGIVQSFTFPASQQNGIAERRIGLVMEVACTSMIHAAAPHFLWPFEVRYAAHQLNLWPRVSEPETSPKLQWTGKVGEASVFLVLGALSLVRDAKASKLSSRALCCIFLGFPTNASPWRFYHPRERRVFSSQDVTFDESICFYRLHPHASHPGPAPSSVSHVDPPPLVEHLEITSHSSGPAEGGDPAADDTAATRRSPRLETPLGFPPQPSLPPLHPAAVDFGDETAGAEPGGGETEGESCGGAATGGAGSWGVASGGVYSGGTASPRGGGAVGDPAGGSPDGGGYGPGGAGAASSGGTASAGGTRGTAGGAGGAAGAGGTRGAACAGCARATSPKGAIGAGGAGAGGTGGAGTAGPGCARFGGAGAAGAGGAVRAGGATRAAGSGGAEGAGGTAGAGGAGAGGTRGTGGAGGAGPGGARTRGAGAAGAGSAAGAGGATGAAGTGGAGGTAGAGSAGAGGTGGTRSAGAAGPGGARTRCAGAAGADGAASAGGARGATGATCARVSTTATAWHLPPAPAPHTEVTESLTERRKPGTRASTLVRAHRVTRSRPPAVPGTHGMALRPSSVPQRVVLLEHPASSLPHDTDPESDLACAVSPTITRLLTIVITDPDLESIAAFSLVTELVRI